jgi:hypothetical protein
VAAVAAVWAASTAVDAQGRGRGGAPQAPPPTAQADAPVDLTGYWTAVITQDWRTRMIIPPKGEYIGFPMSPAGKVVADAWDPAKDEAAGEQCKGYGAAGIMRGPIRMHITWQDPNTLKMDIDHGTQTRLFHFGAAKPPQGERTWQGHSQASWVARRVPRPSNPKARNLKVVTTHMRPAYLRPNGIPYGEDATMTEHFDVFREPDRGDTWMVVTIVVEDPRYLENTLITAANFKKEPNGSKWNPTPCSTQL